ncbi:MAG: EAL domain-containing protein [Ilumatobacteraceae bacterium]|nr:EAL domain-containing protein [Ilumatobacteraceae bacterium]
MSEPTLRARSLAIVSFAAGILILGHLAVALGPDGHVAAWWPAAGVAVAVVAKYRRDRWWLLAALATASVIANLTGGRPWAVALGFAVGNTLEAGVAAAVIAGRRGAVLDSLGDVGRFVTGVVAGVSTIGLVAALTVHAFTTGDPIDVLVSVVPSHATAICLIAPFALSRPSRLVRNSVEYVLIWSCIAAATMLIFAVADRQEYSFLLIPLLLWSVVRLGIRSGTAQLLAVGIVATTLTAWASTDRVEVDEWLVPLQLFIIACSVMVITVGAMLADRERALQRSRASESIYRAGFSEAVVAMMLVRVEGGMLRVAEANGAARTCFGLGIGDACTHMLSDESGTSMVDVVARLAPGDGTRAEMRGTDGRRWFSVSMSRLSGAADDATVSLQIVETTERRDADRRLREAAIIDQLTRLPNMTAVRATLADEIDRSTRVESRVAVVAIDIRGFASVNEVFGHVTGDQVLTAFASRLRAMARDGDTVARVGGDRFVIVSPVIESAAAAIEVAECVFQVTEMPIHLQALDYEVNLSLGVALGEPGIDAEQLLAEADLAVNAAKREGARTITLYSPELRDGAAKRVRTVAELRLAMARKELQVFMQPVVELATGRVTAAEALVRWRLPSGVLRPPSEWLPLVEQTGLMRELGAWILDESLRQATEWLDTVGPAAAPAVHVNVSGSQFECDGFADLVMSTLERHGYPPEFLVLELTETFLARTGDTLRKEFATLASRGVKLAADDFGTGYSPLSRIVELPIHMIKIDRLFVEGLGGDGRSAALVSALIGMSNEMGIDVVAEGIETDEQREILARLGCRVGQGFLWSPAVDARSFQDLVLAPIAMAQLEASVER